MPRDCMALSAAMARTTKAKTKEIDQRISGCDPRCHIAASRGRKKRAAQVDEGVAWIQTAYGTLLTRPIPASGG